MKKELLVLTGACGQIGSVLRDHFRHAGRIVRCSDRSIEENDVDSQLVRGNLCDPMFCDALVDGAQAIVHMAAIATEGPFDELLKHNYTATYYLFEAARRHGVRRIVLASSNHVTGMYVSTQQVTPSMMVNPDSLYGLSKAWAEGLARLYWEKHGIESVCLRIGAFKPEPEQVPDLSMWLSPADTCRLVDAALDTEVVGFDIIYGVSANTRSWWDNTRARTNYCPQDNAEAFAQQLMSQAPLTDPLTLHFQGTQLAATGYSLPFGQENL